MAARRGTTAAGWLAERDSRATPPAKTTGRVYRLASDFGADPSGRADSTQQLQRAIDAAWASAANSSWARRNDTPASQPGWAGWTGPDLGGLTIDLDGG
eukprot:COSAG04_NODE_22578_length_352_cov_0.841897_1_plen_98_part_10